MLIPDPTSEHFCGCLWSLITVPGGTLTLVLVSSSASTPELVFVWLTLI